MITLASIVEGHSEVNSLPILLRRIMERMDARGIEIAKPMRVHRYQAVREGELEKAVERLLITRRSVGAVLLLMDADDDCPAQLGPQLLQRVQSVTRLPSAAVLADTEFEAWFLGAIESLRGERHIRYDAEPPRNFEDIRQAKERLSKLMGRRRYVSMVDQPALAEKMDLDLARERSPSFDKFWRDAHYLITRIQLSGIMDKGR